jgi:hypothetical protein
VGDGGGLDPGVDAELGEDVGDVDAGRLAADEQRLGDLAVAAAGRDQCQYLGLAWLAATVGPSGGVTAVDVNPVLLELIPAENLSVQQLDVRTDELPSGS